MPAVLTHPSKYPDPSLQVTVGKLALCQMVGPSQKDSAASSDEEVIRLTDRIKGTAYMLMGAWECK